MVTVSFAQATAEELLAYARTEWCGRCVCACPEDDQVKERPEQFAWTFEEHFDLWSVRLAGVLSSPEEWASWWTDEKRARDEDSEFPEEHLAGTDMERWWTSGHEARLECPVIIVFDRDGRVHILDGCHRIGISFARNIRHIPVVVGRIIA